MLILLSPSKTQDLHCRYYPLTTLPRSLEKSAFLVKKLQSYDVDSLAHLMKMSEKLAQINWQRFQDFTFPPNPHKSRQALLTFQGDVFTGIQCDTYDDEDFSFAQKHIRILSGLYGVLRPLDLIQPYRLEMSTKFSQEKTDSLYHFWKEEISKLLKDDLAPSGEKILLNLASQEYFRAIEKKVVGATTVDVAFRQRKGDSYKVIAIHAKRARGAMANHIIQKKITTPNALISFCADGYTFNPDVSTETKFTFDRE